MGELKLDVVSKLEKPGVVKSDGSRQEYSEKKLAFALYRAGVPKKEIRRIVKDISSQVYDGIPTSQIRGWIIKELRELDPKLAFGFEYKKRAVWVAVGPAPNVRDTFEPFVKQRIVDSVIKETGMSSELAEEVANKAEHILIESNIKRISGPLIREIVNFVLLSENKHEAYSKYQRIGMPVYDITRLINIGDKENANLQYNPETIHKLIADNILRSYSLSVDIPRRFSEAHVKGELHIHDLDYFSTRPFCLSHDLRFFLKTGFKADGCGVHTAMAGPAKNTEVAVLHAAKVLASAQTNCAGGQGYNWFNIILAPYMRGKTKKQIKQYAQMFIYEMSQMYVARGGQTVFSSIDIEPGIPKTLADIPAVLPGGVVKDSVTYSDFHDEANALFNAITDVYLDGDYIGKPFNFPKYEIKVDKTDFDKYPDEMYKVSQLTAKFGTPYFFIQQDYLPEYCCYQCCSYLMPLSEQNTDSDLRNGTVRGGSIQVVTLNLPQIAYESRGDDARLFGLLRERMDKAKGVLSVKQDIMRKRLKQGLLPFLSQPVDDKGTQYYLVDKQGCEIGMVGLNEMLKTHIGSELHESDEAWKFGLKVISEMKRTCAEYRQETGHLFGLARTPAESASYRLARIDSRAYKDRAVVQGNREEDAVYYSNSVHVRPSADVSLLDRIKIESSFHPLLDGGALSHIWLGEGTPDPDSLLKLTERIAKKTLMSYFAYTRDLTICNDCLYTTGGMLKSCPKCKSENVDWLSRITGYYQRVSSWNKGKVQELKDRRRYTV